MEIAKVIAQCKTWPKHFKLDSGNSEGAGSPTFPRLVQPRHPTCTGLLSSGSDVFVDGLRGFAQQGSVFE